MRLLALSDSLAETDGVGVMAFEVLSAWQRIIPGLEVELWLARGHPPHARERERSFDVAVVLPGDGWLGFSRGRDALERLRMRFLVGRKPRERPGAVLSFKDPPHALVGLDVARRHDVPFGCVIHGTYGVRALSSRRHREAVLAMLREARVCVCPSRFTRARLLEAAGTERASLEKRIRVLLHGIDPALLREPASLAFTSDEWRGRRIVATVAACKERKGLALAFDALSRSVASGFDVHWVIAGHPHLETPYARELRERSCRGDLAGRVHWLGVLDEETKRALLRRAEVHLLTPVATRDGAFEGFGLPYLEAAAAGTISIGTFGSGAEDALSDPARGHLVEPRAEAVEAALSALLERSEDERRRAGERARESVARRTWRNVAEELWAWLWMAEER